MQILGIDPSLNSTGLAIVDKSESKLTLINSRTISMSPGGDVFHKIGTIVKEIHSMIQEYKIEWISMEETIVNKNASSSLKLGMVRGACVALSSLLSLPIVEYKPTFIKMSIVGNGAATKSQVAFMVKHMLECSVNFETEDESDAAAVALTHLLILRNNYNT